MKRLVIAVLLCLAVVLSGFTVYSANEELPAKPVAGGKLQLPLDGEVISLDPARFTTARERAIIPALFDTLMIYDQTTGALDYGLARSIQVSKDGKVFRISLRKGVLFHHGRELTAEDVKFSFDRAANPATGSTAVTLFSAVEGADALASGKATNGLSGVRVIDQSTIQINLVQPSMFFFSILAEPALSIVPKDLVSKDPAGFGRIPVGTGPFKLGEFGPQRIHLVKNDKYWQTGLPYLASITWTRYGSTKAIYDAFVAHQTDFINLDAQYLGLLNKRGSWSKLMQAWPELATFYFGFNVQKAPFNRPEVRRAVLLTINATAYLGLHGGTGQIASGILPPGIGGHNPERQRPARNLKEAADLLTKAGYPGGSGLPPIKLSAGSMSGLQKQLLELVKADLESIGFKVTVELIDPDKYDQYVASGQTNMFSYGWSADYPDPHDFMFNLFHSSQIGITNLTGYKNAQVDKMIDQAREERDPKKRLALYQSIENQIMNDVPIVPTFHPVAVRAYQSWVKGCSIHPVIPLFYAKLWVDKK
ncbi:MAG: ABC transporter substrate-binding protein [Bacillota bacterium]|jgi:oligopeptide transport system substrate-binding protein